MADAQPELNFSSGSEKGWHDWHNARRYQLEQLGISLGIPIGHICEVWLAGGIRLRGKLRMKEDIPVPDAQKWEETIFEIGGVSFRIAEMESCVRSD
jgi:hypothetical protein